MTKKGLTHRLDIYSNEGQASFKRLVYFPIKKYAIAARL